MRVCKRHPALARRQIRAVSTLTVKRERYRVPILSTALATCQSKQTNPRMEPNVGEECPHFPPSQMYDRRAMIRLLPA